MDFGGQVLFALLLSVPIACIVWTVTQEEIFREAREALEAFRRQNRGSFWREKVAYLPTCPYCFSHYVAALFMFLFQFRMLTNDWRGYVVSLFTLVLLSNIYLSAYNLLRVTLRERRAVADREEADARLAKERVASRPQRDADLKFPRRKAHAPRRDRGQTVPFRHGTGPR